MLPYLSISFTVSMSRSSMSTCFFWLKMKKVNISLFAFLTSLSYCEWTLRWRQETLPPGWSCDSLVGCSHTWRSKIVIYKAKKGWKWPDCDITELARLEEEVKVSGEFLGANLAAWLWLWLCLSWLLNILPINCDLAKNRQLVIRGDLVVLLVQAEQTEYLRFYMEHVETNYLCVNINSRYCVYINSEIFTCVGWIWQREVQT